MASISISKFIRAIRALPSDEPCDTPGKWCRTQKEHWLGWLGEYHGPGAYGRTGETRRDAEFVYNHIVEVKMLTWLIEAAGISPKLVRTAHRAAAAALSLPQKAAAVLADAFPGKNYRQRYLIGNGANRYSERGLNAGAADLTALSMRLAILKRWAPIMLTALLLAGCSSPDLLIVDSSGKPIEGARVVGASLSIWGQTTFSDKKGRASVPRAVQPTKWVSVYKDGFTPVENIDVAQTKPIVVKMQRKNG